MGVLGLLTLGLASLADQLLLGLLGQFGLLAGGLYLKVVAPGWPMLLSSLKSLVETGEPLEFRASA